jgi:putative colanic acid biosynthesis acetyltransferase WcaF
MLETHVGLLNKIERCAFLTTWFLLCRWSPKFFNRWRVLILNIFGADIHPTVMIYSSARIWLPRNLQINCKSCLGPNVFVYNVDKVQIGKQTIISQFTEICTASHDYNTNDFALVSAPVEIGSNCWIASGAFVGPNSRLDDGVVLGARSVASGKTLEIGVYGGNPAVKIKEKECIQYLF